MNKIPLKPNLSRRGIHLPDINCTLCGLEEETVDHVFASCEFTCKVWEQLSKWCSYNMGNYRNIQDLYTQLMSFAKSNKDSKFHSALFNASCQAIWKARNEANFRSKKQNPMLIVDLIQLELFNWVKYKGKQQTLEWFSWCSCPLSSGSLS